MSRDEDWNGIVLLIRLKRCICRNVEACWFHQERHRKLQKRTYVS